VIDALLQRPVLKAGSYTHSVVYAVLLWAAITDRESVVSVLGWVHGVGWIVMSLLCLAALRARVIPLWLAVMVVIVGGVGPFAGSIAFVVCERRGWVPGPRLERGMV
jgi:hypothetical protein